MWTKGSCARRRRRPRLRIPNCWLKAASAYSQPAPWTGCRMWRLIPTNGWRSSPREKQNWTKCCAAKDSALFSAAASECGAVSRLLTLLQENGHECWADNYVLMEAHRNIVAKKASILTSIRAADRHNAGCFRIAQSNA